MPKDLKIGLFLGLVLTISAIIWLATRPSLSPLARMSHVPNPTSYQGRPALESQASSPNSADDVPPSNRGQDARDTLPDSAQYEQTEKIKTQKFHIVLKDQTLTSISYKYYGSAGNWQKILDYNKNIIKDPNKLIPGTKLIIPD
jgi:nucleoid-associated protein YgaU